MKNIREYPSQAELLANFEYREDGILIAATDVKRTKKGKELGYKVKNGYVDVFCNDKRYKAHRVIYIMHHGAIPKRISSRSH